MRSVTKGPGHTLLTARHASPPIDSKSATSAWRSFPHKDKVSNSCLYEQIGLCAYSEVRLDDNDLGMHLDHVEPKSKNPGRTFDHRNLLLSAISSDRLQVMAKDDVFGGHYRLNRFSASGFINPLWPDSRRYFHYASNGRIEPALGLSIQDARKARYTIAVMNLNAPLLVNRRRRVIEELEDAIDAMLAGGVELDAFAEAELCDTNGRLQPFHSAARERLGSIGERVISSVCTRCR